MLQGGRSLVHSAVAGGLPLLHRLDLETGTVESLVAPTGCQWASDVSSDGRTLACIERTVGGTVRAWGLPLARGGQPSPLLPSGFSVEAVRFSPDSRYVAFLSDESGKYEVYVAPFPGPGERTRVSNDGALALRWSCGSGEILYLS
jgi:Tol biopolymer transport system component